MSETVTANPKPISQHQRETMAIIQRLIMKAPFEHPQRVHDDHIDKLAITMTKLVNWHDHLRSIARDDVLLSAPPRVLEHSAE